MKCSRRGGGGTARKPIGGGANAGPVGARVAIAVEDKVGGGGDGWRKPPS